MYTHTKHEGKSHPYSNLFSLYIYVYINILCVFN